MAASAASLYTAPDGLDGVHRMSNRDFSLRTDFSFSAVSRKPSSAVVVTTTGSAPARRHISG